MHTAACDTDLAQTALLRFMSVTVLGASVGLGTAWVSAGVSLAQEMPYIIAIRFGGFAVGFDDINGALGIIDLLGFDR